MSRASVVLNRAADEMEKRGKSRNVLINRQGNVCALGALRLASGGVVGNDYGTKAIFTARMDWLIYSEAYRALDSYLLASEAYKNDDQKKNGVAGWNDRNNKANVVKVLREAANRAAKYDALQDSE